MARSSSTDEPDYETFYDNEGREFRAYTAVDRANARFGWGYSTEKPKGAELPTDPVGDPGPTSGAVTT